MKLFWLAYGSSTLQTLVSICFFNFLYKKWKKGEKARNLTQNLAKNRFLKFAPERWSRVLFHEKNPWMLLLAVMPWVAFTFAFWIIFHQNKFLSKSNWTYFWNLKFGFSQFIVCFANSLGTRAWSSNEEMNNLAEFAV